MLVRRVLLFVVAFVMIGTTSLVVHGAFLTDAARATPLTESSESTARAPATKAGIKSFLTKKAVQAVAASFRHGGDLVSQVLKFVDKKAADTAKRHSDDIADDLDRIAEIPDLTSGIVKEQLYNALTRAGIDGGTALQIADGVKRVVDLLVL